MPAIFSLQTLAKFEAACASIPIRPLDRAFAAAAIPLGDDPAAGAGGARRTQFRRYLATIDQRRPGDVARLGAALGAVVGEVAPSKVDYLVGAAERDGFALIDGVFRAQSPGANTLERRLQRLAASDPAAAIDASAKVIEDSARASLAWLRSEAPDAPGHAERAVALALAIAQAARP